MDICQKIIKKKFNRVNRDGKYQFMYFEDLSEEKKNLIERKENEKK